MPALSIAHAADFDFGSGRGKSIAATHKNGSLSLMLVNKDPKNAATVKVTVDGGKLAGPGMRFDYNKANSDKAVPGTQIDEVGNSFTVVVPPYTITDLLVPQAR